MWISWIALFLTIMNEHLEVTKLPAGTTYMAAFMLVALHLYNLNYCQCRTDKCCSTDE